MDTYVIMNMLTKMRKKNDQQLKDVLQQMVSSNKWNEKLNRVKIQDVWSKTMGETVNKYTRHVTLRKNSLVILIDSAPLKQELAYSKVKIMNLINEELGEALVKEVIIH